jgi:site-specific recombinase XerD
MERAVDLPGAAHLVLANGVVHLDPATAVFDAMLEGWTRQQRTRFLKWEGTIKPRLSLVRRFATFTNQYPWEWEPAEVEAFFDHLRVKNPNLTVSTGRQYQNGLRMFMDFITDARYGWLATCVEQFGRAPTQILHEGNSVTHVAEFEGQPGRRPLTYEEVQSLFDAADGRVDDKRARGRKGALTAMRDSALLKAFYAFGLRRQEMVGLDLADLRHNPKTPDFGRYGALFVRFGKSSNGSPPKRRTVFTVPEMDWIVDVLDHYVTEVRPRFEVGQHPAFWVTERRGRLSKRSANEAFETAREAAGLPEELDLHSLRHSMITHLVEFDYPERFVQDQAGHKVAATTAIYTGVSDEYRNRLLKSKLTARHAELWEKP